VVKAGYYDQFYTRSEDAWFAGRVDDVRVYGRKLEPAEVYALAIAGGIGGNHPPVAQNQSASTPQDTAKSIVLVASDFENQPLTYAVLTQPAHGTLSARLRT